VSERAQLLARLQDLELMIQEAEDPASKEREEALGFPLDGMAKLQKVRLTLIKQIPPADLRAYERVRRKYRWAVVPVVNRICGGCFQTLPTSATRGVLEGVTLPTCENCGRILCWT
jgi:predicted  nucleic acid-binding Zn-ribbon protein